MKPSLKEYFFSIQKLVLASFLIFVFFAFLGYFFAKTSPAEMEIIMEMIQQTFGPLFEIEPFGQFLIVFLNNSFILFLTVILGLIFGIFPFFVLSSNGLILGIVVYFARTVISWPEIFALLFPHGIVEIPAVLLASAIGFRLGKTLFDKVSKKQGDIKAELNIALSFFLKVIFPLLAVAAAIEIFITGRFL